ncbi:hypothetical protein AY599_08790 [Leptolyngbya valderiana BDU 20041]|nr:hypothetical protein AY599_08790 [Leptolyngbya valderiana BDU 20041]
MLLAWHRSLERSPNVYFENLNDRKLMLEAINFEYRILDGSSSNFVKVFRFFEGLRREDLNMSEILRSNLQDSYS